MNNRISFIAAWVLAVFVSFPGIATSQVLEDIGLLRDNADAVAVLRFSAPVLYQRQIAAKAGDLVQIYYTVVPTTDISNSLVGDRRVLDDTGLPRIVITDEAVDRQDPFKRRLLVRFATPLKFTVRVGKQRETLELVLLGQGAGLSQGGVPEAPSTAQALPRYVVVLQTSDQQNQEMQASVPAALQSYEVFTSQRVVEGRTLFDISVGYFKDAAAANEARQLLLKRFPGAEVLAEAPGASGSASNGAQASSVQGAPDISAENAAQQVWARVESALARSDTADAIQALELILNSPSTSLSRRAQEKVGQLRLQSGDTQRARFEFDLFLKLYPSGVDSDLIRQTLARMEPAPSVSAPVAPVRKEVEPSSVISGSLSTFYFGGKSKVRSQDFENSVLSEIPVLLSESAYSAVDQKQVQMNMDLNWRYRDAELERRMVVRANGSVDLMPDRPNRQRLSAMYYEQREFSSGVSFKLGRQTPVGGGVMYRFDGAQASYRFAPKWKISGAMGVPTDTLLDTRRSFYGVSVDAEALPSQMSATTYIHQQTIDGQVDRRALGLELRHFKEGVFVSGQLDYDIEMKGLNIASAQGSWQLPGNAMINFLADYRAVPMRSLGNLLFYQDPTFADPSRTVIGLLDLYDLAALRNRVNDITAFQAQATLGLTLPVNEHWQTGFNLNYTSVGEILPVPNILPNGQPSTGDLWSAGAQLIGSNLYSERDTHVFSFNVMTGPTYTGKMLAYNNMTGVADWQWMPALRFYTQSDALGNTTNRWTPGLRVAYKAGKRMSLESEVSYEIASTQGPTRTESARRLFYFLGARFDF